MLGVDWTYHNYERIKNNLYPLVGWESERPSLRTEEAWDVAINHLTPLVCP
jgi:hypothetical protein